MNRHNENSIKFAKNSKMETKFNDKLSNIQLHYKIWMSDNDQQGILGDGKWKFLKLIQEKGSLKAACDELGYTYRRTWGNLQKIEKFFGFPLLEKHRGGSEGGSMSLTPEGQKLVETFDKFHHSIDLQIQKGFEEFIRNLQNP
ncbi:MAG: LysR family transcriptional regulator [Bacteroidota bacterium]